MASKPHVELALAWVELEVDLVPFLALGGPFSPQLVAGLVWLVVEVVLELRSFMSLVFF